VAAERGTSVSGLVARELEQLIARTARYEEAMRRAIELTGDSDCRVHGVRDLYVAGSSVFPTYGCSNPTLTVVALALRLADHLKKQLTG
jgi:hypothetical protein